MSNSSSTAGDTVSNPEIGDVPPLEESSTAPAVEADAAPRMKQPEFGSQSRHEFPQLSLFSETELRKLRARQEEFISSLSGRLSMHFGLEVGLLLTKLETLTFRKFIGGLSNPTHLTLLTLEPLNGTCLLDIPPHLALSLVERELGGPAMTADEPRELGKMEARLLSKFIQTIIGEWCNSWSDLLALRPVQLRHESNASSLQICPPDTTLLVLIIEMRVGELTEQFQLAIPQATLEPLLLKLSPAREPGVGKPAATPIAAAKWNPVFDDVAISVTAELPGLEVTARQLAEMKPGDVIPIPAALAGQISLCLAGTPTFTGALGTSDGHWAVKIA